MRRGGRVARLTRLGGRKCILYWCCDGYREGREEGEVELRLRQKGELFCLGDAGVPIGN